MFSIAKKNDDATKEFEENTLQYINQLYDAALRYTRNETEADDLVQDTYLRAFVFYDRFQQGTNLRAWLFKILTNIFINKYRKKATENRILRNEKSKIYMITPEYNHNHFANPESNYFDKLLSEDIKSALDGLTEDFRYVVILADLYGFSYKEIAEILDCPLGTVMSRLFRGRRILRKLLIDRKPGVKKKKCLGVG